MQYQLYLKLIDEIIHNLEILPYINKNGIIDNGVKKELDLYLKNSFSIYQKGSYVLTDAVIQRIIEISKDCKEYQNKIEDLSKKFRNAPRIEGLESLAKYRDELVDANKEVNRYNYLILGNVDLIVKLIFPIQFNYALIKDAKEDNIINLLVDIKRRELIENILKNQMNQEKENYENAVQRILLNN